MTPSATRRLPNAPLLAREVLTSGDQTVDLYSFLVTRLTGADSGLSIMQAYDLAEERVEALADAVDDVLLMTRSKGNTCVYRWQSDKASATLVHVGLLAEEGVPGSDFAVVSRRAAIHSELRAPSFGDARFERVCRHLLGIYGADKEGTGVTQPTGDGGIDFFGILEPGTESGSRRLATQPYRVAGQAKRWTRSIGKEDVELFVARLRKWRTGTGDRWDALPLWFRESDLPILGLFVTTSEYQGPVRRAAAEGVCICLDGEMISEDLAVSSSASDWFGSGCDTFDSDCFRNCFDS